jgi:hypothetical protein
MGHQSNDARNALRAYARDLHSTANRSGFASPVGTSKQGDAPIQFLGSGAPHQLAIAAAVVCVVLLGGIGFAAARPAADAGIQQARSISTQPTALSAVLARASNGSTAQAIQAFNDLGMSRSVTALRTAGGTSIDSSPAFQGALAYLVSVVENRLATEGHVNETDLDVALAVMALEDAVRPPGLDLDRIVPGLGGTPPGQDPDFTPPGQVPDFVPPGQDPDFVPPGQEDSGSGGRENPPSQDRDRPDNGKGGGRP